MYIYLFFLVASLLTICTAKQIPTIMITAANIVEMVATVTVVVDCTPLASIIQE